MKTKYCNTCKTTKSIDEFSIIKGKGDGRDYRCRACRSLYWKEYYVRFPEKKEELKKKRRENPKRKEYRLKNKEYAKNYQLRKTFGISLEEYHTLEEMQNGLCAICGEIEAEKSTRNTYFTVDHCHITNQIRGLLCNWCNRGLGLFEDNTDRIKSAINYLKKYK